LKRRVLVTFFVTFMGAQLLNAIFTHGVRPTGYNKKAMSRSRLHVRLLALGLAMSLAGRPRPAQAEMNVLATGAVALGTVGLGALAVDLMGHTADCACKSGPPWKGCAPTPWTECVLMPLTAAVLAGTVATMAVNNGVKSKTEDGKKTGSVKSTFSPSDLPPSLRDLFSSDGQRTPALNKALQDFRAAMEKEADPNFDIDGAVAKMDQDFGTIESALQGGEFSPTDGGSDGEGGLGNGANGKRSLAGNGSGGHGSGDPYGAASALGSAFRRVGPADTSNALTNALAPNMLELVDRETGRSLSLFERGTRRYQGVQPQLASPGMRAFILARMEYIRREASKALARANAPRLAKGGAKAPPSTMLKARVVASPDVQRAPASTLPQK
jgi:hypothetical protein